MYISTALGLRMVKTLSRTGYRQNVGAPVGRTQAALDLPGPSSTYIPYMEPSLLMRTFLVSISGVLAQNCGWSRGHALL